MSTPAAAIRTARTTRGLSQGGLARGSGLTPAGISLIERGKREPSVPTMRAILRVVGGAFVVEAETFRWRP
jgi:transcriptional regulator with XRE-family HTH domain